MDQKNAQLIAGIVTHVCQGKYETLSGCNPKPVGYLRHTKVSFPAVKNAAAAAGDFEVFSHYNWAIENYTLSLSLSSLADYFRYFATALVHAKIPEIKAIELYVSPSGSVRQKENSPTWDFPQDHALVTWPEELVKVMAMEFDYASKTHSNPTGWDGETYTIKPIDPRIDQVHEIYLRVHNTKDNHTPDEVWERSNGFLLTLVEYLILASTDIPKGVDPASIGFKDGLICWQVEP